MRSQAHRMIAGWLGLLLCLVGSGCALMSSPRTAPVVLSANSEDVSAKALALYSLGLRAEMNLEHAAAAEAYLLAIDEDPARDRLYQRLTGTYLRTRHLQEAQEVFVGLSRKYPCEPSVFRWLGLIHRLHEHPEEAEAAYRRAMALRPHGVDSFVELAALLVEAERMDEAVEILAQAARNVTEPEKVADALGLYIIRELEGDTEINPRLAQRAADILHDLLSRLKGDVEAELKIAIFYAALNRYDNAEDLYRDLSARRPSDSRIHVDWSSLTISRGRPGEALERLNQALPGVDNPYALIERLIDIHILMARQAESPEEAHTHRAEAIILLERNRASTPDDAAMLARMVVLRGEQGQFPEALQDLFRLESKSSTQRELRWMLIELAGDTTADDAQQERIESALDRFPHLPDTFLFGGDLLIALNARMPARRLFRRALEVADDPSPDPYLRLAMLESVEDTAAALEIIHEGLEALPREAQLLFAAAQTHSQREEYDQALDYFSRSAEILRERNPTLSIPFLLHYALTLQLSDRVAEAVDLLSDERLDHLDFLQTYTAMAQGRMTDATRPVLKEVLEQLGERHPGNPWVLLSLGMYHYSKRNYESAEHAFSRVEPLAMESELIPEETETPALPAVFYFWHGATLERLNRIEDAEIQFRRALQVDEHFAEAQNYLAYMWAESGQNLEEGLALIERALAQQPDNGAFIDTRGWIYFMMGRYENALVDLKRAAELEEDAVIHDHLGDTYQKLGRIEDAIAAWTSALRLDPDKEEYRNKLQQAGEDVTALLKMFSIKDGP